jgi:hypothetical protein
LDPAGVANVLASGAQQLLDTYVTVARVHRRIHRVQPQHLPR